MMIIHVDILHVDILHVLVTIIRVEFWSFLTGILSESEGDGR